MMSCAAPAWVGTINEWGGLETCRLRRHDRKHGERNRGDAAAHTFE